MLEHPVLHAGLASYPGSLNTSLESLGTRLHAGYANAYHTHFRDYPISIHGPFSQARFRENTDKSMQLEALKMDAEELEKNVDEDTR